MATARRPYMGESVTDELPVVGPWAVPAPVPVEGKRPARAVAKGGGGGGSGADTRALSAAVARMDGGAARAAAAGRGGGGIIIRGTTGCRIVGGSGSMWDNGGTGKGGFGGMGDPPELPLWGSRPPGLWPAESKPCSGATLGVGDAPPLLYPHAADAAAASLLALRRARPSSKEDRRACVLLPVLKAASRPAWEAGEAQQSQQRRCYGG